VGPSELRAKPAAVPPALTIAMVAAMIPNFQPAKSFPNPVGMSLPFAGSSSQH
jgi:hypothetical protein